MATSPVWNPMFTHTNWSKQKAISEKQNEKIPDTGMGNLLKTAEKEFKKIKWDDFAPSLATIKDPTRLTDELRTKYEANMGVLNDTLNKILVLLSGPKLKGTRIAKQFHEMANDAKDRLSLTKGLFFKNLITEIETVFKEMRENAKNYGEEYRKAAKRAYDAQDSEQKILALLNTLKAKGRTGFTPSVINEIEKRAQLHFKIFDETFPLIRETTLVDKHFTDRVAQQFQCAKDLREKERGAYGDLQEKRDRAIAHDNLKRTIPALIAELKAMLAG